MLNLRSMNKIATVKKNDVTRFWTIILFFKSSSFLSTWQGECSLYEHHCVEGTCHVPKIHFPALQFFGYFLQVYYVQLHKRTHTFPDIVWVSVCPCSDSASTGMTSVHPMGKGNFHTDRQQASQHLCSCLSKQELRQTDKNSVKMCQPPRESLREKDMGGMGEKLRAGRMNDNICLCLPVIVVCWYAGCEQATIEHGLW